MFKSISPYELNINPFEAINKQWMLITAGNETTCNTMTASWGGLGIIWGMETATCYIRPQRYTMQFVDENEYFSLCFFSNDYRSALNLCGTASGRDCDKIKEAGLTVLNDRKAPYFEEAEKVFICRKLHRQRLEPDCFIDKSVDKHYAGGDYHYMFIGEIVECLVKE